MALQILHSMGQSRGRTDPKHPKSLGSKPSKFRTKTFQISMSFFTHRKGKRRASAAAAVDYEQLGIELATFAVAPRPLVTTCFVYDMEDAADRLRCIRQLWKPGGLQESLGSLVAANEELAHLLQATVENGYRPTDPAAYAATRLLRLDCVLADLVRMQNQKKVPLLTAATSVLVRKHQLSLPAWGVLSAVHKGLLASANWTERMVKEATAHRPPPPEPMLKEVACTVFDNYSRRCLYKAQVSEGQAGYRLDMTNWGILQIPRRLLPSNFDGRAVFENLYRNDISLRAFVSQFNWRNLAMVQRKQDRFVRFLKAAAVGELLQRPATTPNWVCGVIWYEPIWGRLQSSHDDVKEEMNHQIRNLPPGVWVNIQGGDGLSVQRCNEQIANEPELFLDTQPAVVPILGEHPHGVHHIMHTVHRNFEPFVMRCAEEVGNKAIVSDPAAVMHFNSHFYFHCKLIRASSEWLFEKSRGFGGLDFEDVPSFMRATEANIDLAWLAHYIYDGGFLLLDFKQAVRANDCDSLDADWAEFVTLARTGTGHKTHYGYLAMMQVYRSQCLHPQLAALLKQIRTLPMSSRPGARVGWDTPCEWLHAAITASVTTHVSDAAIWSYIQQHPFMDTVDKELRQIMGVDRSATEAKLKDMDADVAKLKVMFDQLIGATWAHAARQNNRSNLLSNARGARIKPPWQEYEDIAGSQGQDSNAAYVRRHLSTYAFRHEWKP